MKRYKSTELELIKVSEAITKFPVSSPQSVFQYMKAEAMADREIFWVLHLNTKNKVVKKEMTAMGCIDSCRVVPGIVLRGAVASGVPSIISVHNHPSGEINPSSEDRQLWDTLRDVCKMLGIRVMDNMVIGANGYYSEEESK
ncbi:MAG: hypothetical protein A2509_07600 [Candidatus Edwardsbacteria bacterium RIFOXYD12_FULL_50_11]|uniref:MPN domain-containing protein n=1 Tax=Candidatus Edwardsbacteria bacterium GWF2_54_11 TaxID=1817851 RepID=A0A1F5RE21_9BACT|nr:MAG: hypothetical protein A2502_00475 [Candidatus Edwardsbacteria bacterium RifOxyC12_full_54_24]OGF06097.1 MAG: hypothetical protein A2273_09945 [Candidatus Edwardsbacteria bacterium RifOxyA12_full_54_48]OGF12679.1 MAG: hypothetical protein A2024_00410 [Candidatus Edwardsbacteria bacterium GWF2_54_11]OGF17138.1 MAG: hypothetical protein A2509_07600 [Candidatus Edwardsbacteria bacterium RIFOXYD12_FULL_50_11]OGJ18337.1 MAG: hypothetical protein A2349_11790 [Candidatus Edwardsbacteria bacteriu